MIQLEGLAGISPSVFFYCSGDGCRFALSCCFVLIAPADHPFSGLVPRRKMGWAFFCSSAGSDQMDGDFLVYLGLMGAGNRLEDGLY